MLSQTSYPCRAWYPTGVIGEFGGDRVVVASWGGGGGCVKSGQSASPSWWASTVGSVTYTVGSGQPVGGLAEWGAGSCGAAEAEGERAGR